MKSKKRFFYFYGGAIGGFLVVLYALECFRSCAENSDDMEFYIVSPNRKKLYEQLTINYPHVKILNLNKKNIFSHIPFFLKIMFSVNYVATPPSFGPFSLITKIIIASITKLNKKSMSVCFDDGIYWNKFLFKKSISHDYQKPIFEKMHDVIRAFGCNPKSDFLKYKYVESDHVLNSFKLRKGKYIIVHMFASAWVRSFPKKRWANLLDDLVERYSDIKIVITGSPSDKTDASEIINSCRKPSSYVNTVGETDLQGFCNLVKKSLLCISVDTGNVHLASVLEVPVVVIGNCSNPSWLPSYNKNAVILTATERCVCKGDKTGNCFVFEDGQKYYRCLYDIKDTQIFSAIEKIVA